MKRNAVSTVSNGMAFVLVLSLTAASVCGAQAKPFKFSDVEYMPRAQREPAAQAFLAQAVPPGTPLATAKRVLRQAGAFCPASTDATLHCTYSSMRRPPGHDEQDLMWNITVQGDRAGRVQTASVTRTVRGN